MIWLIIIIACILSIAILFLSEKSKKWYLLSIGIILIGVFYQVNDYVQEKDEERKSTLVGKIDIPGKCEMDSVNLFVGSFVLSIPIEHFKEGKPISHLKEFFGFDYPLSIKLIENSIVVGTKIKSIDGKIIAEIKENNWIVNPNNYYLRNYDNYAFEVIDSNDIPMLQVEMIDECMVSIKGVFIGEEKMIIINEGMEFYEKDSSIAIERGMRIKRLFEYPSEYYLGKRAT